MNPAPIRTPAVLLALLARPGGARRRPGRASQAAPCTPPVVNPVACENTQAGRRPEHLAGRRAPATTTIQGFATSMSVNKGETISFKIKSTTSNYHIDILRLGYYGGDGARLIAGEPRADRAPPTQPACQTFSDDRPDRLRQLGASRASWTVPSTAVSGVYIAHLVRNDTRRRQPDPVRRARRREPLRHRAADLRRDVAGLQHLRRQQPLHSARSPARPANPPAYKAAYKVSYNRPVPHGRGRRRPLVAVHRRRVPDDPLPRGQRLRRQLHRAASTSTAAAALLLNHKVFISSGHDEYWSATQRDERRGRARRRRQPRVLQRQRGVLEDALGAEHRRHQHAGPHARLLQGHALHGAAGPGRVDRHLARPALHDAADERHAGERAHRPVVPRQLRHVARSPCPTPTRKLRLWRNTAAASARRPGQTPDARARHARLRVGRSTPTTASGPPAQFELSSTTVSGLEVFTDYGSTTHVERHRDAQPDAVPRAQRRAACSAPAPCSGPGASTTRTRTATPPTATCSRRR